MSVNLHIYSFSKQVLWQLKLVNYSLPPMHFSWFFPLLLPRGMTLNIPCPRQTRSYISSHLVFFTLSSILYIYICVCVCVCVCVYVYTCSITPSGSPVTWNTQPAIVWTASSKSFVNIKTRLAVPRPLLSHQGQDIKVKMHHQTDWQWYLEDVTYLFLVTKTRTYRTATSYATKLKIRVYNKLTGFLSLKFSIFKSEKVDYEFLFIQLQIRNNHCADNGIPQHRQPTRPARGVLLHGPRLLCGRVLHLCLGNHYTVCRGAFLH